MMKPEQPVILMADDDEDDRLLAQTAFAKVAGPGQLVFVHDGEELMEYLQRRDRYNSPHQAPRPHVILLDLNMPRKDGREALKEIKADPALRGLPVVVLTTSRAEEDIGATYHLGANSYIAKPVTFQAMEGMMRTLRLYWFNTVELPRPWGGA